eukprot:164571-Pleurochrysis_carterae.AAC.6
MENSSEGSYTLYVAVEEEVSKESPTMINILFRPQPSELYMHRALRLHVKAKYNLKTCDEYLHEKMQAPYTYAVTLSHFVVSKLTADDNELLMGVSSMDKSSTFGGLPFMLLLFALTLLSPVSLSWVASSLAQVIGPAYDGRGDTPPPGGGFTLLTLSLGAPED